MHIWELIAHRLRMEGWDIWHQKGRDASGLMYFVHLQRPGGRITAEGPSLTEAFLDAARRARDHHGPHWPGPRLQRGFQPVAAQ
ncbi:MAG: hypothetical protein IRY99_19640 [Isosphaeraceae bacterium]|nr:hypothetical protein [Isosphaeraceae bacterium]